MNDSNGLLAMSVMGENVWAMEMKVHIVNIFK